MAQVVMFRGLEAGVAFAYGRVWPLPYPSSQSSDKTSADDDAC